MEVRIGWVSWVVVVGVGEVVGAVVVVVAVDDEFSVVGSVLG